MSPNTTMKGNALWKPGTEVIAGSARMPLSNQKRPSTSKKATRPDFYLQVGRLNSRSLRERECE